jgi:riboflavin biosynthesis pyrimidine reductase
VDALLPDLLAPYAAVDRVRGDDRCWTMANMVGGLDGSAAVAGRVAQLSNDTDSQLFLQMRALADVVMVGAQTVRAESYGAIRLSEEQAAARLEVGRLAHPVLAVVTRSLDLDWSAKAFLEAPTGSRPLVVTCEDVEPSRLDRARNVAQVVIAGSDRVDPKLAMARLWELGHRVVLCEGGPTWLGQLVAAEKLDELCLTIAPVMGGDPLPISVTPAGADLARWRLCHVLSDGDTLFLRYERAHDG